MAYSSKWEMTILEIQTRDIHTTTPTHTCPTLWHTYAWLCLISHCIFCSLFIYFCTEFLWQYHAMHKFFRALDNPPPPFIQEQTSRVSRFWGQSHGLTMRHKNLTVNRFTSQWNTLIEYFHFTSKKWFSWINYVEIHSSQAYSSLFVIFDHLVDMINAKQGYCYQFVVLDAFRTQCQNGGKGEDNVQNRMGKFVSC